MMNWGEKLGVYNIKNEKSKKNPHNQKSWNFDQYSRRNDGVKSKKKFRLWRERKYKFIYNSINLLFEIKI